MVSNFSSLKVWAVCLRKSTPNSTAHTHCQYLLPLHGSCAQARAATTHCQCFFVFTIALLVLSDLHDNLKSFSGPRTRGEQQLFCFSVAEGRRSVHRDFLFRLAQRLSERIQRSRADYQGERPLPEEKEKITLLSVF